MQEVKTIELTKSALENLSIEHVIYAETSVAGAMGNAGGIMIYVIDNNQVVLYESNMFEDSEIFQKASEWLLKYQNGLKVDGTKIEREVLSYHYGGMGNHVFVNKRMILQKADGKFIYSMNNANFEIAPSVRGVYNAVVYSMENSDK